MHNVITHGNRSPATLARIAVIGMGYTGLGTSIALAKRGHTVTCVDTNPEKVTLLSKGRSPLFEPGFSGEIAALSRRHRLIASIDTPAAVRDADIIFLSVGTPSQPDGSLDTTQLGAACLSVGEGLRGRRRQLVVVKSTVVPGTTESVVIPALESKSSLHAGDFGVCVNPEFLREGHALEDSLRPSHIVIGERDRASGNALLRIYAGFACPKVRTSVRIAEAVKYATNAFLATKVTFANELANICTRLGLDVDEVLRGMSLDPRINPRHLVPGVGFGGSCFPKDLRALVSLSRGVGYEPFLLTTTLSVNERQHMEAVRLLENELRPLSGKRVAILGLAFKGGTDDVRESKALAVASELLLRGAHVVGYDPKAAANFTKAFRGVEIAATVEDALRGSDACIIQAAWPEFSRLGPKQFALMQTPIVIDGRRTWTPRRVPKGIRYRRIG